MGEGSAPAKGSICHVEMPAPDMAKLMDFYGRVFDWSFTPMGGQYPEYAIFHAPGGGGGLDPSMPVGDGGAVLVLAVPDIPASLAQIEKEGGTVLTQKTEIGGGHGFCAYFRDPCGNKMCVWSMT